jgi:hypothetical protein
LAAIGHTDAVMRTCNNKIDQLTLDTFPLVKTVSEELIGNRLETCICTSAESYHLPSDVVTVSATLSIMTTNTRV